MDLIILAAGEGKRLRPLTNNKPKCLVEIDGISLLRRQLEVVKKFNFSSITVVSGYEGHKIKEKDISICHNNNYSKTNMLVSLSKIMSISFSSDVIVSYGDIVYHKKVLERLINCSNDIALAVDLCWENYWKHRTNDILSDVESLSIDNNGYITDIGKKVYSLKDIEAQYIGLMKFSNIGWKLVCKRFQDLVEKGSYNNKSYIDMYMTDFFQYLIDQKDKVCAVPFTEPWVEIDTLDDFNNPITISRLQKIKPIT